MAIAIFSNNEGRHLMIQRESLFKHVISLSLLWVPAASANNSGRNVILFKA